MRDVTIGIPVFNEETYIEQAIRSAAPQCNHLIISDNASTDSTYAKCQRLAKKFSHMQILRQPQNIGAGGNFKTVLDSCTTPYFMWLGGHDHISFGYVQTLVDALENTRKAVMAFGNACHIDRNGVEKYIYTYPYSHLLQDISPITRLLALVRFLSDCTLLHGVIHTGSLRKAWVDGAYLGTDHVLLSKLALSGRLIHIPSTCLYRRDVHINDTKGTQLQRIATDPAITNTSFTEMKRQQFTLVCETARNKSWRDTLQRETARLIISMRYGAISENRYVRCVEAIEGMLARLMRKIRRRIHHRHYTTCRLN